MAIRQFPDLSRTVYDIASLPFDAIDLRQAVARVIGAVQGRIPLFISTPNLNFLIAAQSDQDFRRSVRESDLSLADGMPIVWLARLLDVPIRQRVAGSDLFEALCLQTQQTIKVFFFGGPPGAAEQAGARVNARTHQMQQQGLGGGVQCVGFESPGFGSVQDMSTPDILQRINASGADFVVVALGARKGQAWIQHNRAQLDAPVICHLGAVVNMAAGTIARAPRWMRLVGLEWVWRIKEEPQLWRRYGADGLAMLRLLLSYVVPQMWGRWRQRQQLRSARAAAHCSHEIRLLPEGGARLVLQGAWTQASLGVLRGALADCVRLHGYGVQVDSTQATYLDAAVRGLLGIVARDAHPAPSAMATAAGSAQGATK